MHNVRATAACNTPSHTQSTVSYGLDEVKRSIFQGESCQNSCSQACSTTVLKTWRRKMALPSGIVCMGGCWGKGMLHNIWFPASGTWSVIFFPRNLKGGIRSLLPLVLTLSWDGDHFDSHIWRWVIVHSELTQSFGAICVRYGCRVFCLKLTMRKGNTKQNCLACFA